MRTWAKTSLKNNIFFIFKVFFRVLLDFRFLFDEMFFHIFPFVNVITWTPQILHLFNQMKIITISLYLIAFGKWNYETEHKKYVLDIHKL